MVEPPAIVSGYARDGFEQVAEVFARVIAAQRGGGAAFAVYRDGVPVIDLVGGDYPERPLQLQFSVSKAVAGIAAVHAIRAGLIDVDAPIAEVWPAFDRASTRDVTTAMILSHTSGLAGIDVPLTIEETIAGSYTEALEVQEPYWRPGEAHGYHAFSYGFLLDGVFRRSLGVTVGEYIREHLAEPLDLELWLGLPDELIPRVSPYVRETEIFTPLQFARAHDPGVPVDRGFEPLVADMTAFNRPELLRRDWPATNVVAGARDLARLFASTLGPVDGVRLIDAGGLDLFRAERVRGLDRSIGIEMAYGLGVQLPWFQLPYLGPSSYGHEGAGGAVAFGDVDSGLAVSFMTNRYPVSNGAAHGVFPLLASIRHLLDRGV